jgi:DnaJ family protein A protein 2
MKHGQRVTFRGEADDVPGQEAGDVVIVLQQRQHERFRRDGANLVAKRSISLRDALCGLVLKEVHLDGRELRVASQPGQIIKPGDVLRIEGEGMPTYKRPFEKGDLLIEFEVPPAHDCLLPACSPTCIVFFFLVCRSSFQQVWIRLR